MKFTHEELKSLIKESLADSTKPATTGGLAGAIGGIPQGAQKQASGANDVVNLFLSAFGLGGTPGGTAGAGGAAISGDSWVGLEGRQVWQALKDEFGITVSKDWYKKLPYDHPARVKFREWWNSKSK